GKLGMSAQYITPGYEDTWYYMWRERRLPVNVDPFDTKLDDAMERARLRRVFSQGLDAVVGYVLPLKVRDESAKGQGPQWSTGPWFFRDERMYLMPGDSPMGYRLPLDSVPWVSKTDYPYMTEADPFAPRDELPSTAALAARYNAATGQAAPSPAPAAAAPATGHNSASMLAQYMARYMTASGPRNEASRLLQFKPSTVSTDVRFSQTPVNTAAPTAPPAAAPAPDTSARMPKPGESAAWLTRTALCVEVRDPTRANGPQDKPKAAPKEKGAKAETGALYIFMPPLERLEDYLDLLAAVEASAQTLGLQIVLEGYPPPRDPRLKMLQVTPDPGVIEVNIHPAYNWNELVEHTEFLYKIAHETRLSAEKFMTDGRHTGTGGGNHFVLGG
ncbi:MAG: transglutaminase family protein, partial [Polaromonas sp.]|nr:transglutaminase family protein [Polaromonas sp.]